MDELRSWWEVPSIAHFCSLFRVAFNLFDFEIEELEEAFVSAGTPDGSPLLSDLLSSLLAGCYARREIRPEDLPKFLYDVIAARYVPERGGQHPVDVHGDFYSVPLRTKVEIVHAICDYRLDADDVWEQLKGLDGDNLRLEPLGRDATGALYWYFYGSRLYKEIPPPKPKIEKEKRKRKKSVSSEEEPPKVVKVKKKKKSKRKKEKRKKEVKTEPAPTSAQDGIRRSARVKQKVDEKKYDPSDSESEDESGFDESDLEEEYVIETTTPKKKKKHDKKSENKKAKLETPKKSRLEEVKNHLGARRSPRSRVTRSRTTTPVKEQEENESETEEIQPKSPEVKVDSDDDAPLRSLRKSRRLGSVSPKPHSLQSVSPKPEPRSENQSPATSPPKLELALGMKEEGCDKQSGSQDAFIEVNGEHPEPLTNGDVKLDEVDGEKMDTDNQSAETSQETVNGGSVSVSASPTPESSQDSGMVTETVTTDTVADSTKDQPLKLEPSRTEVESSEVHTSSVCSKVTESSQDALVDVDDSSQASPTSEPVTDTAVLEAKKIVPVKREEGPVSAWSLCCSTVEDWTNLAESFRESTVRCERDLHKTILEDFLPEIPRLIEEKEKLMRKRLQEMAPRRQSTRIEKKAEIDRLRREQWLASLDADQLEQALQEEEDQRLKRQMQRDLDERRRKEEEKERIDSEKRAVEDRQRAKEERAERLKLREERSRLISEGKFIPPELSAPSRLRYDKSEYVGTEFPVEGATLQALKLVMGKMSEHHDAWLFRDAVDEEYAPGYYEVIDDPMDLATMKHKLASGYYTDASEFAQDFKLIIDNCIKFNGFDSQCSVMAGKLERAFHVLMNKHLPDLILEKSELGNKDPAFREFETNLKRRSGTQRAIDKLQKVTSSDILSDSPYTKRKVGNTEIDLTESDDSNQGSTKSIPDYAPKLSTTTDSLKHRLLNQFMQAKLDKERTQNSGVLRFKPYGQKNAEPAMPVLAPEPPQPVDPAQAASVAMTPTTMYPKQQARYVTAIALAGSQAPVPGVASATTSGGGGNGGVGTAQQDAAAASQASTATTPTTPTTPTQQKNDGRKRYTFQTPTGNTITLNKPRQESPKTVGKTAPQSSPQVAQASIRLTKAQILQLLQQSPSLQKQLLSNQAEGKPMVISNQQIFETINSQLGKILPGAATSQTGQPLQTKVVMRLPIDAQGQPLQIQGQVGHVQGQTIQIQGQNQIGQVQGQSLQIGQLTQGQSQLGQMQSQSGHVSGQVVQGQPTVVRAVHPGQLIGSPPVVTPGGAVSGQAYGQPQGQRLILNPSSQTVTHGARFILQNPGGSQGMLQQQQVQSTGQVAQSQPQQTYIVQSGNQQGQQPQQFAIRFTGQQPPISSAQQRQATLAQKTEQAQAMLQTAQAALNKAREQLAVHKTSEAQTAFQSAQAQAALQKAILLQAQQQQAQGPGQQVVRVVPLSSVCQAQATQLKSPPLPTQQHVIRTAVPQQLALSTNMSANAFVQQTNVGAPMDVAGMAASVQTGPVRMATSVQPPIIPTSQTGVSTAAVAGTIGAPRLATPAVLAALAKSPPRQSAVPRQGTIKTILEQVEAANQQERTTSASKPVPVTANTLQNRPAMQQIAPVQQTTSVQQLATQTSNAQSIGTTGHGIGLMSPNSLASGVAILAPQKLDTMNIVTLASHRTEPAVVTQQQAQQQQQLQAQQQLQQVQQQQQIPQQQQFIAAPANTVIINTVPAAVLGRVETSAVLARPGVPQAHKPASGGYPKLVHHFPIGGSTPFVQLPVSVASAEHVPGSPVSAPQHIVLNQTSTTQDSTTPQPFT